VSETMTQLEKVTQQNAAMVEEASAAAGSLEDQSKALANAVSEFKLHDEAMRSAPAPKVSAAKAAEVKHAEVKKPAATLKVVEAKKPQARVPAAKPVAHKGNGQLEEGWQEF